MAHITTNDGIQIYYEDHGQGRPIVLVPGWTTSTQWWQKQIPVLQERYRVIAMDMRGSGQSEKTLKGQRLSRHAHDVHDLLERLDLTDVTLVGWSVGVATLFSYFDLFGADRLRNAVFVDMTPKLASDNEWHYGQMQGNFTLDMVAPMFAGLRADQAGFTSGFLQICFHRHPTQQELDWMLNGMLRTPTPAAFALLADHTIQDWRDVLPTISVPVLAVAGKYSPFPYQSGEYIASHVPNGRFLLFEESGHCPFYEEPEKFNEALIQFAG